MEKVLRATNLTKIFTEKEAVLKGITLDIEAKSFTVLSGPSGSGKSTLLNILSGLLKPTEGQVYCNGKEITGLPERKLAEWKRRESGNIFQNYLLLQNLTVRENIEIGIPPHSDSICFQELAEILELDGFLDKFPYQLSGGQQQRTAIARAAIKKPTILFCDEVTGALDEANSKKVVSLLHSLTSAFGITILFVTHNMQIAETANRILTIKNGLLYRDRLNANPISAEDMVWE